MSEQTVEELAAETLSGDLRDVMLTHIRSMGDPWSKMSEKAQSDKIYAISNACETMIRRAVAIIAARDIEKVFCRIAKFTVKDGIKAELTAVQTVENIELIAQNLNQPGILVFASPEEFLGQRAAAKADPDQPALIEDEDGEEPATPASAEAVITPEADPSDAPEAA